MSSDVEYKSLINEDLYGSIIIILNILSCLGCVIILMVYKKQSNFMNIFINSIYAEGFLHIGMATIYITKKYEEKSFYVIELISKYNVLLLFSKINTRNVFIINCSLFFSMLYFSILINLFMYLEFILLLKNPIDSSSFRTKMYNIISFIISLVIFIYETQEVYENKIDVQNIFSGSAFTTILMMAIYCIMVIFCIISMIYTIKRLGNKKFLKFGSYNTFLFRQISMHFIYFLCYTPFQILIISWGTQIDFLPDWYYNFALLAYSSLGFIQFFFRVSDTKFYKIIWHFIKKIFFCCNKNNLTNESDSSLDFVIEGESLTLIMNKLLNLEFIGCVLYGLTDIFSKRKKKLDKENYKFEFEKEYSISRAALKKDSEKYNFAYKTLFNENDIKDQVENKKDEKIEDIKDVEININSEDNDATITEHCSQLFHDLRQSEDVSYEELLNSLNPEKNKDSMLKIKESEGKSGSFFFFSHDNKFVVKTLKNHELDTMLNVMESYYCHIFNNQDSLLARIYGLYTIKIK